MLRAKELAWFYQEGASFIFPDAWEHYLAPIPEEERAGLMQAASSSFPAPDSMHHTYKPLSFFALQYHRRLHSPDEAVVTAACKAWSVWEGTTSKLFPSADFVRD